MTFAIYLLHPCIYLCAISVNLLLCAILSFTLYLSLHMAKLCVVFKFMYTSVSADVF